MRRQILSADLERHLERHNLTGYLSHAKEIALDIADNLPAKSGYTLVTQHHAIPVVRGEMQKLKNALDDYLSMQGSYHVYLSEGKEDPNKLSLVVFNRG